MHRSLALLTALTAATLALTGCAGPSTDSRFPQTSASSGAASNAPAAPTTATGKLRAALAASIAQTEKTGLVDAQSRNGEKQMTFWYSATADPATGNAMMTFPQGDPMALPASALESLSPAGARFRLSRLNQELSVLPESAKATDRGFQFTSALDGANLVTVIVEDSLITGVSIKGPADTETSTFAYTLSAAQAKQITAAHAAIAP